MKRKVIYTVIGVGVIVLLAGARYISQRDGRGYLGKEIVFFQEDADSERKEEAEQPEATKNSGELAEATPAASGNLPQTDEPPANVGSDLSVPEVSAVSAKKNYEKIHSNGKVKVYNNTGTVVAGDAAYELYNYVNSAASRYTKAINKLTKKLDSSVKVYDLVAPTSMGITFPDNKKKKINSSDQEEALSSIEKKLSGREIFVPLYDVMMQHRKEYIFFRTDHHWTSLGAYYAYQAFCDAKGIIPHKLSDYKKKVAKGFLGSFYRDTNQNKSLRIDTLESYYPVSKKLSMEYTTTGGQKIQAPVIADASKYSSGLKYCAFIAGDNPYTIIRNKGKRDGSSCVVIKESYGNAFVPYLADHYQTVYVIDYRYWEGKLCSFIKKKKSREVILINNISMTRNSYLIGKLMQIIS